MKICKLEIMKRQMLYLHVNKLSLNLIPKHAILKSLRLFSGTEADHLRSLLLSLLTSEAMDQFQAVIDR